MNDNVKTPGGARTKGDVLLEIRGLQIEGESDEVWHEIVKGVDLTLASRRGARPDRRVRRRQVDHRPRRHGLCARRLPHHRRQRRVRRHRPATAGEAERRKLRGSRIAYVAQTAAASFNPAHRLIDQTIETPTGEGIHEPRPRRRSDAIELYRRLRLPNPETIGDRYPHQVSGGQLQRAMTAMAMSCRPDLIVFDEPTTALDVTTQIEVLAAIRDVVEQFHTAAIYITHDLAVVAQMADRIMVLRYGELVEEAPTREMLSSPQQAYTKSLWAVRSLGKEEEPGGELILRVQNVDGRLRRHRQGAARRDGRRAARPHGRRGRRVRFRQVDPGARHHRPAAAVQGRDRVRRPSRCRLPSRTAAPRRCGACR